MSFRFRNNTSEANSAPIYTNRTAKFTAPTVSAGTPVSTSQGLTDRRLFPSTWVSGTERYATRPATAANTVATANAVANTSAFPTLQRMRASMNHTAGVGAG
jgi:hypothetical protein